MPWSAVAFFARPLSSSLTRSPSGVTDTNKVKQRDTGRESALSMSSVCIDTVSVRVRWPLWLSMKRVNGKHNLCCLKGPENGGARDPRPQRATISFYSAEPSHGFEKKT